MPSVCVSSPPSRTRATRPRPLSKTSVGLPSSVFQTPKVPVPADSAPRNGHYPPERQKRFLAGLVDIDVRTSRAIQRLFIDAPPTVQDAILAAVEDVSLPHPATGSFWRDLKELTLIGFYTSRIGIEDELQVNFFPGAFDGCAPLDRGSS